MPVLEREGAQVWRRRTKGEALWRWFGWMIGVAVFVVCWQRISGATTWFFVWDAPRIAEDIWTRATPPRWEYITQLGRPIWDTLNIATLGTLIALFLAVPVAFLAARNTTPSALFIRPIALLIIVSTRSINSLIWALLLIAIIGPGVFAGVIAIAIRSIGFCAKLLYEAIEEIDHGQVEAITATGASRWPGHGVRDRAPDHAGLCRGRGLPVGHQHPRVHRAGPGRGRGDRSATVVLAERAGLAAGQPDPACHPCGGGHQRMGIGQGARSDHLMALTAESAFDAYEAVRHRLPAIVPSDAGYCRASSLADIADAFDVFLLDAFGVLNIGEAAIPGTRERIEALKAAGKRVLVVSNAAGFPHKALTEKYARLGYDFAPEDVITSRATLLAGLNGRRGLHWGLMATRSAGLRDLEDLRLTYLEEAPEAYDTVEGFLLVGSAAWTEERQELLEEALMNNPRPVLVGNPDIVAPREAGFSVEPGHFAHRLADRTGITPEFYGKPFPNIFDLAFRRLGDVDRSRVVMVGDSLHTDILGARNIGISSALIANYGFFAGQDAERAISAAGIVPDFILERP